MGIWTRIAPNQDTAPLSERRALHGSSLIVGLMLLAYWLTNYGLPGRASPDMQIYVIRPLIWLGIGGLSYLLWRRVTERPSLNRTIVVLGTLAAAFNVSVLLCAGVLLGFGNSPYSRQALHMAENFWYLATFILGLEMARAYLLTVWSRVNTMLAFVVVSLLCAAIWFAPSRFNSLTVHDQALPTAGRTFMPATAESLMSSFLASLGGPVPAFIYHLSLESYRWLSPILPRLDWAVAALIGTLAPAIAMIIVRDAYFAAREATAEGAIEAEAEEAEEEGKGISPLLLFGGAAIVALIWLNTGMLGVEPGLISGPSMKPYLGPGDMVMIKDVRPESLKAGDVIQFRQHGVAVIHRIKEVKTTNSSLTFVTQGDNNNVADEPITAADIDGKMVLKIPELGWIPIKIRDALDAVR